MIDLKIVIGSTRHSRAADRVVPWVVKRASEHGAFDVDVLDLRDWRLPMFQEHMGSIGDFSDPTYSDPLVRRWNQTLSGAEAVLVVTPEYNHSIPGELKNALDSIFVSFAVRNKPLGAVAYSGANVGGARAVEHLMSIAIELEMVPTRDTVLVSQVDSAFGEDDNPRDPVTDLALGVVLDNLAWWAPLLSKARAEGQLPPGRFRLQAARAKLPAD